MSVALLNANVAATNLHDEIIGALPVRYWFKDGTTPLSNRWVIGTGSVAVRKNPTITIDFDQCLTAFPSLINLLDPERERDLITIKLVVYHSLDEEPVGWNKSPVGASNTFRFQLLFLKWRIQNGIESYAKLNAVSHRQFVRTLRSGGRDALLSMPERIKTLCGAWDKGEVEPYFNQRGDVDGEFVARMLGLQNASSLTSSTRAAMYRYITQKGLRYSRTYKLPEKPIPQEKIAEGSALDFLKPWTQLWKLRELLSHDPIGYRAHLNERDISSQVKWAKTRRRTKDAPEYQTSWLIDACLKLVHDDVVKELFDIVENGLDQTGCPMDLERFENVNDRLRHLGFPEIRPIYSHSTPKGEKPHHLVTIRTFLLVFLPIFCSVVICAFTARRDDERNCLKTDCVEIDANGNMWLNCLIAKNIRDVDRIPIPSSVKAAVDIVRRLHSHNRFRKDEWLFNIACPVTGRPALVSLAKNLKRSCNWLGVPQLANGETWVFTPHQFRKFFGTTYFHRWMFPNLTALSFHYRHFNPDTTRGYLKMRAATALRMGEDKLARAEVARRNIERERDTNDGRWQLVRHIIQTALDGAQLAGSAGQRITQQVNELKERFLPELEITKGGYDEPGFEAALEKLVRSTPMQVHPEGHSVCLCNNSNDDKSKSKCLALKQMLTGILPSDSAEVDFDFADDETCLSCPHSARVPAISPYWENALAEVRLMVKLTTGEQRDAIERRIAAIEVYA
ncbi:hypothetical protein HLH89_33030 [Rhizobium laguerreae]|uniref:hypothetical protein n=1 Tax=Rhizobium laguerreae TaxID=1076926 RepID=UPI0014787895|nr:hypothetical protein [Rhizobium laguerreae]NNH85777.1 hypothetical protein [Rhizobium laguerreae]